MIINKIFLKNFYRYGNNEQCLDLTGSGITAIVGNNGYGKSTCIVDSLAFAFFGQCRDVIDDVVNRYVGKDCKVSVEFTEGGKSYKVIRYRKHTTQKNNVYLFKGEEDISGHTASDTNQKIIDVIKMNYIAFTNSSVFSSELYSAFLAKRESDRLVIFENILSLKEITLFYTEIKKIIKELDEQNTEKKLSQSGIKSEISTLENTISSYSANAKTKLLGMKADKENAKKTIEEAKEKIKELSIIDIDKEKSKLLNNTLKDEYESKLSSLKREINSLVVSEDPNIIDIINKYSDINFENNRIKELKYKEDLETINIRTNGYKLAMEQINSLTKELSFLEKEISSNQDKILESKKRIDKLSQAICPFCGQHLEDAKVQEEISKETAAIASAKEKIEELIEQQAEKNRTLEEQRESYNWLLADAQRLQNNLNKDFIPNSDYVEETYKNALNKHKEIVELKIQNESKINEYKKEIEEYKAKLDALQTTNYTEEELNSISEKIDYQNKIIADNETLIAKIDASAKSVFDKSYVDGLKAQQEKKQIELESLEKEIETVDNDIKHYQYLGDCFSNKSGGFKKYFIGEMIDMFNERINQYLPFFFSEKVKITFDKNLSDVITMDDFKVTFNSFSQGQRQRAELAISFALFDVARVFFSNDNKLLILDEMDKGLDKFGIKAMVNLLNGFDKQLRIFIVSHNPLMGEEIDSKVEITRDENEFSVIKQ